tara:strand:+ start:5351 stop:5971 length:621 start_codon:yes stop_codon:yes gene_type:complete
MTVKKSFLGKLVNLFISEEKKKEKSGWIKCPGCKRKLDSEVKIKRFRPTANLDHIMCECGTVSHWLFTLVMVCVGYGRFRTPTPTERHHVVGDFVPNRILEEDNLWFYPQGNIFYFIKRGMLVPFYQNDLPRSVTGKYCFEIIEVGRRLSINDDPFQLGKFGFVRERFHGKSKTPLIYDADIDPGVFLDRLNNQPKVGYRNDQTRK